MNATLSSEHAGRRTPNDVSALCVELLRALREQEWNAERNGGPAPSVDRAWRAWRADLDRYGPLHLVADAEGLRAGESGPLVGRGRLDELAQRLRARAVASVRFEPGLDAPTYGAFISLLLVEPAAIADHGGAAGFLPERGVGIRLLDLDEEMAHDAEKPDTHDEDECEAQHAEEPEAKDAPDLALEPDDGDVSSLDPSEPSDDPDPSGETTVRLEPESTGKTTADLALDSTGEATAGLAPNSTGEATAGLAPNSTGEAPADLAPNSTGEAPAGLAPEPTGETTLRMMRGEARSRPTAPATAEHPDALARALESGVPPPPGSALAALSEPGHNTPYGARVAHAVAEAVRWSDAGDIEACHRTVLALADHAGAQGGLGRLERSAALGGLRELCTGRVLCDLIVRAASRDREVNLRASRVLLELGEPVVAELIAAIDLESDPSRREELLGIAIAMGRATTPTLHRTMEGSSPERARIAARIAGEIRDERAVPTLSRLLDHKRAEVRGESARALARIGNVAALTTLKRGLASHHEDVSSLCAYCLGITGSPDAAQALTETLREARRARRTQLASAVIRSLGRLGREESVPELQRVIDKRSFFRRQELRELKLQAIGALAKLPGQRARDVLDAVAQGSDMGLAVAARRALKEATEASA